METYVKKNFFDINILKYFLFFKFLNDDFITYT